MNNEYQTPLIQTLFHPLIPFKCIAPYENPVRFLFTVSDSKEIRERSICSVLSVSEIRYHFNGALNACSMKYFN